MSIHSDKLAHIQVVLFRQVSTCTGPNEMLINVTERFGFVFEVKVALH